MRHASASDQGFTLIEVLVALVMSAMLMVIVIDGSVSARDRIKKADNKAVAVSIADAVITRAGAMPFVATPQNGRVNDTPWQLTETVESTDRRGLLVLVRFDVAVGGTADRPLFKAQSRKLVALPRS